jgi:hypothetical protein
MHISFTLAQLTWWLHAVLSYNCTAVQDPTVRDLMGAISSLVNTPIGALVTLVVVDEVVPPASTMANTPIRALVIMAVHGVGADASLTLLTDTVPSSRSLPSGRSPTRPSPSVPDMQTPHDAAVGKTVDQPLRSLLQPDGAVTFCP